MPRRTNDPLATDSSLAEERQQALSTALLRHRAALVALARGLCDFAHELRANGLCRDEILAAARELVTELRASTASVPEEASDDEVLDAMVLSCLDEMAFATDQGMDGDD